VKNAEICNVKSLFMQNEMQMEKPTWIVSAELGGGGIGRNINGNTLLYRTVCIIVELLYAE
jgi:hypothetical protein